MAKARTNRKMSDGTILKCDDYYTPAPLPRGPATAEDEIAAFLAKRPSIACQRYRATISVDQCLTNQGRPDNIICPACTQPDRATGTVTKRHRGLLPPEKIVPRGGTPLAKKVAAIKDDPQPHKRKKGVCTGCGRPEQDMYSGEICRRCRDRGEKGVDLTVADRRGLQGNARKTAQSPKIEGGDSLPALDLVQPDFRQRRQRRADLYRECLKLCRETLK